MLKVIPYIHFLKSIEKMNKQFQHQKLLNEKDGRSNKKKSQKWDIFGLNEMSFDLALVEAFKYHRKHQKRDVWFVIKYIFYFNNWSLV